MATRDDKRWKLVPPGSFAGKKIAFASTHEVDGSADLASEFMSSVFAPGPGDYAISDESGILDFMPFDQRSTDEVWARITQRYGLTPSGVGSERLVDLFRAIAGRRGRQ